MSDRAKKWVLLLVLAGLVLAIDQTAKWFTVNRLVLGETWEPIPAIGSFIKVMRSHNTGAAFGMFPLGSNVFLVLAIVTTGVFILIYPQIPQEQWLSRVSIALVIGGALSNAIDRIRFGHVIDYFYVQISPQYSNISNFADHFITVGVILLLIDQWRIDAALREAEETQAAASLATRPENSIEARLAEINGYEDDGEEEAERRPDFGITEGEDQAQDVDIPGRTS